MSYNKIGRSFFGRHSNHSKRYDMGSTAHIQSDAITVCALLGIGKINLEVVCKNFQKMHIQKLFIRYHVALKIQLKYCFSTE